VAETGYLLLFDVSGYTRFMTGSDLAQAPGILQSLLGTLIENVRPPLKVAELEGDAVFAFAPASAFRRGQTLVEVIEDLYCVFCAAREQMERNAACDCSGCRQFPQLDLKVIAHRGEFDLRSIVKGHPPKPIGSEVILAHRLLKNRIIDETGVKAYAFFTRPCVEGLGLDWLAAAAKAHTETYEHLGAIDGWVHDLEPAWARERERRLVTVSPDDAWIEVDTILHAPPQVVWDHISTPEFKSVWRRADRVDANGPERLGVGSVQRCYQGETVAVERIMDWRPFQRMTLECEWLPGVRVRIATELEATSEGTRLRTRLGRPSGAGARGFASRWYLQLRARQIAGECRENLERLRAWIAARGEADVRGARPGNVEARAPGAAAF
jgi:hypothetical protein